jgi:tetratricopeptide (TPR) repeat protein
MSTERRGKEYPSRSYSPECEYYLEEGTRLSRAGARSQALPLFYKALEIDPDCDEGHYEIALIYEKNEDLANAREWYEKTIELNPDHHRAHCNLGSVLKKMGYYAEAEKQYQLSLEVDPTDAIAIYNLGMQTPPN